MNRLENAIIVGGFNVVGFKIGRIQNRRSWNIHFHHMNRTLWFWVLHCNHTVDLHQIAKCLVPHCNHCIVRKRCNSRIHCNFGCLPFLVRHQKINPSLHSVVYLFVILHGLGKFVLRVGTLFLTIMCQQSLHPSRLFLWR